MVAKWRKWSETRRRLGSWSTLTKCWEIRYLKRLKRKRTRTHQQRNRKWKPAYLLSVCAYVPVAADCSADFWLPREWKCPQELFLYCAGHPTWTHSKWKWFVRTRGLAIAATFVKLGKHKHTHKHTNMSAKTTGPVFLCSLSWWSVRVSATVTGQIKSKISVSMITASLPAFIKAFSILLTLPVSKVHTTQKRHTWEPNCLEPFPD